MNKIDAMWIGVSGDNPTSKSDKNSLPSPCFRREFNNKGKITKATLKITGLGVFYSYINGKRVSDDFLMPGWVDFTKQIPFCEYDVTCLLKEENCIGVIIGEGWYMGRLGLNFERCNYGSGFELCAELIIENDDGQKNIIRTNEKWSAKSSEIIKSSIFDGEYVDHRLYEKGWDEIGFKGEGWYSCTILSDKSNLLVPYACEPIQCIRHLDCKFISKNNDKYIYDTKQNMAGIINAVISGANGSMVIFRYGEMLKSDGSLYIGNLRNAESTDYYICNGDIEEVFEPLFTYHGFRYVEVTLIGDVVLREIKAMMLSTNLEETGRFNCSNPLTNQIYQNTKASQESNFLAVPTDCPQRDERLGWTGDVQVFCLSAMFMKNCKKYFEKYLRDVRESSVDYVPNIIAPSVKFDDWEEFLGISGWADVITILPYQHYIMYGDINVLLNNIDYIRGYMFYCLENCIDFIRIPNKNDYGDWLSINDDTDKQVLSTAFFAISARLTSKIMDFLNYSNECEYYKDIYEKIKISFKKSFIDNNGRIKGDSQTSYLLAYEAGIFNQFETRDNLIRLMVKYDFHLSTGFIGIRYLLPILCEIGKSDIAYDLITKTSYPSWGYSIVNGATTIWERWNSYTNENGFESETMNSFNHYSYGSCVEWMYSYVLGIVPSNKKGLTGFKSVTIRPFPDPSGKVDHAEGSYKTEYGITRVEWKRCGNFVKFFIEIPSGIDFTLDFKKYKVIEKKVISKTKIEIVIDFPIIH